MTSMNRAQAKRHIKATTYTTRGCAPYRRKSKAEESERIQRMTEEFVARGGEIKELDTHKSEFRPTWQASARGSFEDNHHEA